MAAPSSLAPSRPRALALLIAAVLLAVGACTPAGSNAPSAGPTAVASAPGTTTAPPTDASTQAPAATTTAAFPVTLTDDEGTEVTIPAAPARIVSLTPSTTEILFALGAGDRVVAKVEDIANHPPEAADVPIVATFAGVDVERIVALEADLVISAGAGLTQGAAVEQLRRAEIPVFVAYPTTVEEALTGIRQIGRAVGLAAEGAALATAMDAAIEALSATATSAGERPRVFYEIDVTNGIFTPPAKSIYGEMLTLANSEPISGDASYSISLEDLVAADPEVILLGDAAYGVTPESVGDRPGWSGMTAVEDGRIHPIDDVVVTRPGPRLVNGLYELIRAIHPDLAAALPSPAASLIPVPA